MTKGDKVITWEYDQENEAYNFRVDGEVVRVIPVSMLIKNETTISMVVGEIEADYKKKMRNEPTSMGVSSNDSDEGQSDA